MDRDFNVESERREIGQRLREDLVREAARDRHQPEPLGARARLKLRQPRHYPRPHGWNTRKAAAFEASRLDRRLRFASGRTRPRWRSHRY